MSLLKGICQLCNKEFCIKPNMKCLNCGQQLKPDECLKCHNRNDRISPAVRYGLPALKILTFPFVCGMMYLTIIMGVL